jgi:hypothetical protein
MLCGAALIAWSILAPTSALVWNVLQKRGQSMTQQNITSVTDVPLVTAPPEAVVAAPPGAVIAAPQQNLIPGASASTASRKSSVIAKSPPTPAARQRVLTKTASAQTSQSAAEEKAREEIMSLYQNWKTYWRTHDLDSIMKLYSPQVRFRPAEHGILDYKALRPWFEGLWSGRGYIVRDTSEPHLSIRGGQAILIAGQSYTRGGRMQFTSRYLLQREVVQGSGSGAFSSTRRWRIIEEDFLSFQGNTDVYAQIY